MSGPVTSGFHGAVSERLRLKTLVSRSSCIVNSPELSDVKFIFKNVLSGSGSTNGHGQGQGQTIIYGHKLILALASPVFHKMFYMDKAGQQFVTTVDDEIHMDGCGFNAEAFLKFIRFVYTDRICYNDLDFEVIVEILTCADYYDVPCLKVDCADELLEIMTKENVFRIMEIAGMFGERDLVDKALKYIDRNPGSLVEAENIPCIKLETLFEILKRDSLDIDESFVLDIALKWAGSECERKNWEPTARRKREVLGKVFFEIRFGLLTSNRISELVFSNLLSARESMDVVLEYHTPGYVTTEGNSNSKRLRLAPEMSFKSNPRIFGQKKKLMEVQELEKKWKERNNFDSLKALAMSSAKGQANLFMNGFSTNKTEDELGDEIQRARLVLDLDVRTMDPNSGAFHVQFKYNSSEYRVTDLVDPTWYQFDNPLSIYIWRCYDDSD